MSLITTYQDPIALTHKREQDEIIKAAQEKAFGLAVDYNVDSCKHDAKLGMCYLVSARRTKAGINTTYRNEAAILRHNNMGV
jgi:hypothetical protein